MTYERSITCELRAQKEILQENRISESTLQKSLMENQTSEELQGVFIRMQVYVVRVTVSSFL